jgi:hypothetical protein
MRIAYTISVGNLEAKTPFGRTKIRWKENTKTHLQEVGFVGVNWTKWA